MASYPILDRVNSPSDLRKLSDAELSALCGELRAFMLEKVTQTGGHLASNLGAVELSVGIHRVFSSPKDKIIFDVGHQAYVHKILTGRKDRFDSLRAFDGISGFMRPAESVHDPVVTGHASTSVSSAVGLARAMKLRGEEGKVVCVIGDGAMTGGIAYEALNDLGETDLPVIVVFNDNDMSIARSVGAVSRRLSKIRLKPRYFKLKASVKKFFNRFAHGEKMINRLSAMKNGIKSALLKETIFEILGLKYLGPADGNDLKGVISLMSEARKMEGPVVVHFKTVKGKGYAPAEADPDKYHGVPPLGAACERLSCAGMFGEALCELASHDDSICAVTAAMESGTGLRKYHERFPARFFDVGIAEEHAVTMAAGMACGGAKPVVCLYSTFLQRAFDQMIHDVAIAGLHVVFAIDHTGIVGEDGATHHGLLDPGYLLNVPGLAVLAPASKKEMYSALKAALYSYDGPVAVRYPKDLDPLYDDDRMDESSVILRQGNDAELICYGSTVSLALKTADVLEEKGYSFSVRKLSRLDDFVYDGAKNAVFIEDCMAQASLGRRHGIKTFDFGRDFVPGGNTDKLFEAAGMTPHDIAEDIIQWIK